MKVKRFAGKPGALLVMKLLISAFLLLLLLQLSIFENITAVFIRINPVYLAAYYFLYILGISIQVLRWQFLLKAWDIRQGFGALLRWSLTGMFLNNFLPGGLGGDAFRLYSGSRTTGRLEDIAATIFYERILSYGSLVILGLGSLIIRANYSEDWLFWLLLGCIFLSLVCVFAILSLPGLGRLVTKTTERYPLMQKMRLKNWLDSFGFRVRHPRLLIGVFSISFLIQLIEVFLFSLVASAIQIPVKLSDLFLFVPLLYLAVILPFSVNGIGIRETVFVIFASRWDISQSEAIAFSLTVFTLTLAGSLIGGPIYWIDRMRFAKGKTKLGV
jgi:uncharacterized protein (TIRG00374 family)